MLPIYVETKYTHKRKRVVFLLASFATAAPFRQKKADDRKTKTKKSTTVRKKTYTNALLDRVTLVILEFTLELVRLLLRLLYLTIGPSTVNDQQVWADVSGRGSAKFDGLVQLLDQRKITVNLQGRGTLEFRNRQFQGVNLQRRASTRDKLQTVDFSVACVNVRTKKKKRFALALVGCEAKQQVIES